MRAAEDTEPGRHKLRSTLNGVMVRGVDTLPEEWLCLRWWSPRPPLMAEKDDLRDTVKLDGVITPSRKKHRGVQDGITPQRAHPKPPHEWRLRWY